MAVFDEDKLQIQKAGSHKNRLKELLNRNRKNFDPYELEMELCMVGFE